MITRFRDSLVYPKNIIHFRKDPVWVALLYVLFFALLLGTRTTIEMVTFDGLRPNTQETIRTELSSIESTCAIVDAMLVCDDAERTELFTDGFVTYSLDSYDSINTSLYDTGYNIIVQEDALKVVVSGAEISAVTLSLSDLPESLQNLDFGLIQTDNDDQFYESFFEGVNTFLVSQKSIFAPIIIVSELIANLLLYMFFILISAWFMKMRFKPIKFKELFVMTVYSATALYLILIFDSLFSLSFFLVIVLVLIAFRQNNALSTELYLRMREYYKNIEDEKQKKQDDTNDFE
jgi:hypothetical protein